MDTVEGGRRVRLDWRETGGPPVRPPVRRGFGTRLITAVGSYELDGEASPEFAADGFRYRLEFMAEAL